MKGYGGYVTCLFALILLSCGFYFGMRGDLQTNIIQQFKQVERHWQDELSLLKDELSLLKTETQTIRILERQKWIVKRDWRFRRVKP